MKIAAITFFGLTGLLLWVVFWTKCHLDHDWPFLICLPMAVFLPIAIFAALLASFMP